jgi:hypothetical protein
MARGTMQAPKPDDQRRRRNAPTHGEAVLPREGDGCTDQRSTDHQCGRGSHR